MKKSLLFFLSCCMVLSCFGGEQHRQYTAARLTADPPEIDGMLDEEAWKLTVWDTGFTQHEPYSGRQATQETRFAICFDNHNIYVAIRATDTAADSIVRRMTRRDHEDGDNLGVAFDSFYDKRTCFVFGVSASGTKFDWIISEDGQQEDRTWDPVWWVETSIDEEGWTAEMRIPLSQLRFDKHGAGIWGMQVFRFIHRNSELSFWSHIPKDAPGIVHMFGTMHGMGQLDPRRVLDLMPYTVASASRYPASPGNPFLTGSDHNLKLGMDAKMGITNNFTVDLTVNPDFGQVESDPSEVNLTAFETFFVEKRPFFIEGKNITSFNMGVGDGGIGNDNLFYSRRIGRRPAGSINYQNTMVADVPQFTHILGAAKLTGKTSKGLSVAIIETMTAETKAETDVQGNRSFQVVEPLTNFVVGRVQKDQDQGNTIFGLMTTAVHRKLEGGLTDQMHRAAYSSGVDFTRYFRDKSYMFNIHAAFSHVVGSEQAILRTQMSSARYFQQETGGRSRLDAGRESLTGTGGRIQAGKIGDGHLNFLGALLWKSPGFEINDIGYMREADQIIQLFWMGYKEWEPKGIYRQYQVSFSQYSAWNFWGRRIDLGGNVNGFIRYRNYWSTNAGIEYSHAPVSRSLLRGGPAMILPDQYYSWLGISSDNRKNLMGSINGQYSKGFQHFAENIRLSTSLSLKVHANLNMSFQPSYNKRKDLLQYVKTTSYNGVPRYVMGSLNQEVIAFSFRLNLTVLPELTLQYWGQPFVAVGIYDAFKYIRDPEADDFDDTYRAYYTDQIRLEGTSYYVDEDRDGSVDYTFGRPDFRFREFLSNLVIRWEYNPGSVLYLVWSQDRSLSTVNGDMHYFQDLDSLFSEGARNTFLVKFSYRFGVR